MIQETLVRKSGWKGSHKKCMMKQGTAVNNWSSIHWRTLQGSVEDTSELPTWGARELGSYPQLNSAISWGVLSREALILWCSQLFLHQGRRGPKSQKVPSGKHLQVLAAENLASFHENVKCRWDMNGTTTVSVLFKYFFITFIITWNYIVYLIFLLSDFPTRAYNFHESWDHFFFSYCLPLLFFNWGTDNKV